MLPDTRVNVEGRDGLAGMWPIDQLGTIARLSPCRYFVAHPPSRDGAFSRDENLA